MGKGRFLLERFAVESDLAVEPLPGQSIVEIAGDRRVLIENHMGVRGYSCEKIWVNVRFGTLCVCGSELEIRKLTREQMVICGKIEGVTLQRRR